MLIKNIFGIFVCCFVSGVSYSKNIEWYVDNQLYANTSCESGDDVILPAAPTKQGYTFTGWNAYIPIEYLESTGTQYIDTKVYQKDAKQYGMSLKYEYSNATSNTTGSVCGFMGFGDSSNNWGQPYNVGYGRKSELWGGRPNRLIFESNINISPNTVYYDNFSVNVENGTATRMFNGYTQNATGIPFSPGEANYTQSVFLFAANGGWGSPAQNVSIRLYYAKFF